METLSFAVLLLIGEASAVRHHHRRHHHPHGQKYVQFDNLTDDLDDRDYMTVQSISESEALHGQKLNLEDSTYKKSIALNTRLGFEGDTFDKVFRIDNSWEKNNDHEMVEFVDNAEEVPISQPIGVRFVQAGSDPIHGSLGPPDKAKIDHLSEEQELEERLRQLKPQVFKPAEDMVITDNSITVAEKIVGSKMPEPKDPKQMEKMKSAKSNTPSYYLADSDDEDPDTVETRRSVKTAEKMLKHRFFINAHEQREYEKKAVEGKINSKELEFNEDEDAAIGAEEEEGIPELTPPALHQTARVRM